MSCYLTFEAASQGTLFLNWSTRGIEGALASFEPRKKVPAFKFKQNGGRAELIREMSGGTGERIKRYYSGWCSFVKLAKSFDGLITIYAYDCLPVADIHLVLSKDEDNVRALAVETPTELANVVAVAAVHHPNPSFEATTMSPAFFVSVGNREGAALTL